MSTAGRNRRSRAVRDPAPGFHEAILRKVGHAHRFLAPLTRPLRALATDCGGATAVETAFVLPGFLLCMFAIAEIARALWIQSALQYAVEDAARCAAINTRTCGDAGAVQTYAAGRAFGMSIPASSFNVTNPTCGKQVSVSYAFNSLVPNLVPLSLTLAAQSCHP